MLLLRCLAQGLLTTLAIGLHNVPEGLAKATVLVSQGVSARQALFWSVMTCLPQPLVAVPAFVFVETFTALLPAALGFAGGCMVWMVFAELLPDALDQAPHSQVRGQRARCAAAAWLLRPRLRLMPPPPTPHPPALCARLPLPPPCLPPR